MLGFIIASHLFTEAESTRHFFVQCMRELRSSFSFIFIVKFYRTTCELLLAFGYSFLFFATERNQRQTNIMGNSKTKPEPPPKESSPRNSLSYSSVPFQLQIRNCLRNVRGNSENSFTDVCPDQFAPSTSTRKPSNVVQTFPASNILC